MSTLLVQHMDLVKTKKDTNAQQDNRSIIVKLCRRETKDQIYSVSPTIRNSDLYANESP